MTTSDKLIKSFKDYDNIVREITSFLDNYGGYDAMVAEIRKNMDELRLDICIKE